MDISNYIDLSQLLAGNALAIEYEVQYELQHQIMVEASAAKTQEQKNALQELLNKARVSVVYSHNTVSVDMYFLDTPKELESYAEMLQANASLVITPRVKELISDCLNMDEARDYVYDLVKDAAINQIRSALGGVL